MDITNQQKHDEDKTIIENWIIKLKVLGIYVKVEYTGDIANYNDSPWVVREYCKPNSRQAIIQPPQLKHNAIMFSPEFDYKSLLNNYKVIQIDLSMQANKNIIPSQKFNNYCSLMNELKLLNILISEAIKNTDFDIKIDINIFEELVEEELNYYYGYESYKFMLIIAWRKLKLASDTLNIIKSNSLQVRNSYVKSWENLNNLVDGLLGVLNYKILAMFDEEHSIITSKYNTEYISKLILELFKIIHGNWLKDNNGNLEFDENILSMTHELEQSLEDVINGIIIRKSILTRYRLSP